MNPYARLIMFMIACLLQPALVVGARAQAVPVVVEQTATGWSLSRDGKPYTIKGAGGDWHLHDKGGSDYLKLLAQSGGNSIRTWGVGPETKALLDEAHRLGLTVMVGIWLEHERHGYDYNDFDFVSKQFSRVRETVLAYKDHPAVLAWGVGNEMEGYEDGDSPAIWSHVEACAAMIKRLDPSHPTVTVIAEIGGRKVEAIHKLCPSVDIVGINSYAGGTSLPGRYVKAGGVKPYIVTEFGPAGAWEVELNGFGAPHEPSSTQKGPVYAGVYRAISADTGNCVGSYAFLWGSKIEATATWFGMFLNDGSKLASVDAMSEAWAGSAPADLCPAIVSIELEGKYAMKPGSEVKIALQAEDPEDKPVTVRWMLMRDSQTYMTGGDRVDAPPSFPDHIVSSSEAGCTLTLPDEPGVYRVYAVVKDPAGNAAIANLPLSAGPARAGGSVAAGAEITPGMAVKLPFAVYTEADGASPWISSGYMGNGKAVKLDPSHAIEPHAGKTCIKIDYSAADEWAGVVWQDPVNDWGDAAGGYDLTGAKALEFWARGEKGGEVVNFGFGVLGQDAKHPDSGKGDLKELRLTDQWRRYRIELGDDVDMRRIKTGFYWSLAGQGAPVTFYLDDIRFVTDKAQ